MNHGAICIDLSASNKDIVIRQNSDPKNGIRTDSPLLQSKGRKKGNLFFALNPRSSNKKSEEPPFI